MALKPSPACRPEPVFNKILENSLHLRKDLPRFKDFPSNIFFLKQSFDSKYTTLKAYPIKR